MAQNLGFIGLGNVGGKLAGCLLRNGFDLIVHDLERDAAQPFIEQGAVWAKSPGEMTEKADMVITCLPSPEASASVMASKDGILSAMGPGKIWAEMSTTDEAEVKRHGKQRVVVGLEKKNMATDLEAIKNASQYVGRLIKEIDTDWRPQILPANRVPFLPQAPTGCPTPQL